MDEVTHELWKDGEHKLDYDIRTARVKLASGDWTTGKYSVESLKTVGWEVIPVHVELENK